MRPLWPSLLSDRCLLAFLLSTTRNLLSWLESYGSGSSLPLTWMIPHSFSRINVGFHEQSSFLVGIIRRWQFSPPQLEIPHSFWRISVGFSRGCSSNIIIWRRSSRQLFTAAEASPPQLHRRWLLHLLGLSFFSPLAELFGSTSKRHSPTSSLSSFSPPCSTIFLSPSTVVSL